MNIDVYDTYAVTKSGNTIHFDVLLPRVSSKAQAIECAQAFMVSIGEASDAIKAERCLFCHSEFAHPIVEAAIMEHGHYILQMEGCPNPSR